MANRMQQIKLSEGYTPYPPGVLRLEPSSLCNLKCIHCPTSCVPLKRGIMSLDIFQKIICEVKDAPPRVAVLYHGGEPFFNKDIFYMAKSLKNIGVSFVKTVTNGMLLTDETVSRISESEFDQIEFSIDGNSPMENNAIRRGSDYQTLSNVIKKLLDLLLDKGSESKLKICISNVQIPTEEELYRNNGNPKVPDYLLKDFLNYSKKKIVTFKTFYPIIWPSYPLDKTIHKMVLLPSTHSNSVPYCDHLQNTLTVRQNGDIVACCYDITNSFVIGNITQTSLKEIWNNKKYSDLRRGISTNS